MDYILQMEKLYKFFELKLELEEKKIVQSIKKEFCSDMNLLGCYVKDFLTIENNGTISSDDEIYNDFVICFDNCSKKSDLKNFLLRFQRRGKYFLNLVFEKDTHRVLKNAAATINSLYCIEAYPYLIELEDDYFNQKINNNLFSLMLTLLIDIIIKSCENQGEDEINYSNLKFEINSQISKNNIERLAI